MNLNYPSTVALQRCRRSSIADAELLYHHVRREVSPQITFRRDVEAISY